ncbi:hypothetical protein C8Q74DRAFT_768578 [Fomes fomentarius]|nr:hypothetical protein C8Q74DRAFT_768578 [Fomes fomentarius]
MERMRTPRWKGLVTSWMSQAPLLTSFWLSGVLSSLYLVHLSSPSNSIFTFWPCPRSRQWRPCRRKIVRLMTIFWPFGSAISLSLDARWSRGEDTCRSCYVLTHARCLRRRSLQSQGFPYHFSGLSCTPESVRQIGRRRYLLSSSLSHCASCLI